MPLDPRFKAVLDKDLMKVADPHPRMLLSIEPRYETETMLVPANTAKVLSARPAVHILHLYDTLTRLRSRHPRGAHFALVRSGRASLATELIVAFFERGDCVVELLEKDNYVSRRFREPWFITPARRTPLSTPVVS